MTTKTIAKSVRAEDNREFVRALARGLAVIESFDNLPGGATLSDIASRANLNRGTVRRALITLQRLGYVAEKHGRFSLLPRTLRLGYSYLSSEPLGVLARPYVEEVHAETGETTSLSVLDEGMIVYLIRAMTSRLLHDKLTIGSGLPGIPCLDGTSASCGVADSELDRYLRETEFTRFTPLTVVDPVRLRALIDRVREVGFAGNDQELELGLRSIAVPIFAQNGGAVAALNVGCSSARFSGNGKKILTHLARGSTQNFRLACAFRSIRSSKAYDKHTVRVGAYG